LDAPASAVIGVPDKTQRRGGLMPARRSNAVWRGERGTGGCIAMSPRRWTSSKEKNAVPMRCCEG